MAFCCSARAAGPVVDLLPPIKPLDLEDVLNDKLASMMLLKFAETEHSTENVLFLLEVHELNLFVQLKAKLRRMLTRRSETRRSEARRSDARRSDARRSDTRRSDTRRSEERRSVGDHCRHSELRKLSTMGSLGGGLSAHSARAIELTRAIIKKHVANNNLCLTENIGGGLRKWLRDEDKRSVPNDLIGAAYAMTLRTVKQDIFPRFRESPLFDQLLYVHLGRTLQHAAFYELFEAGLTPIQRDALAFWSGARALEERRAPGMTEAVQLEARALVDRHEESLGVMCPDELEDAKANADSDKVLAGLMGACQNQLVDPYVALLESEKSKLLLHELGIGGVELSNRPSTCGETQPASPASIDDDSDWAAGW